MLELPIGDPVEFSNRGNPILDEFGNGRNAKLWQNLEKDQFKEGTYY